MPYVRVETNIEVTEQQAGALLTELTAALSRITGKPESVVQVAVHDKVRMLMGGTVQPTAHVAVKGIGFRDEQAGPATEALCRIMASTLLIKGDRVFVTFESFSASMWGKDGRALG